MRERICGPLDHPSDQLNGYQSNAPDGDWTGGLDDRAWGKAANLFCYFTDIVSAEGYRLCVFFDKAYRPAHGGPTMDQELLGREYRITTRQGKKILSQFVTAKPVDTAAPSSPFRPA